NATAPQGMPIQRAPEKTAEPDVYKIDFPIKPGESNIQLNYSIPFTSGAFQGRVFYQGGPTSLIAPAGVTLKGEGLEAKGPEPRTQANIFQTRAASFKVEIEGTGMLRQPQAAEADQSSGPSIQQILPKVYTKLYWVLGLSFAILTAGFLLFYRAPAVKDRK
ncbi:MAG: hypothetical protein HY013_13450, partial [Candidatus Solibacter usitatus]|nr:hypothetical protein [Candidatus Solibacter usitatus]